MLFIKSENKIVKIKLADIYFIHADQSEVVIYTNNSEFKLHSSINELKEKKEDVEIEEYICDQDVL
jgi:DNA-binding LytR/AlgR family response regulator